MKHPTDLDAIPLIGAADALRAEVLATLKAGEERWRQRASHALLPQADYAKARAFAQAYRAALTLMAPADAQTPTA